MPEQVDVRQLQYLNMLDHCRDCDQDYICHLLIRHSCGCYLAKWEKEHTFWQTIKSLFRKKESHA